MRVIFGSLVALALSLGHATHAYPYGEPDTQPATDVSIATSDQYPRVTALENALLGQSFPGQALGARLSRMETKVFGSAFESPDLGDRTDKLEAYAEEKLHKKLFQPDPSYQAESPEDDQGPPNQSDYPRIVALEKAILGQSFPGEAPADRLSRMESKAFGSPSSSADLSERTESLQRYAEKRLHKKVVPQQSSQDAASGSTSRGSQLPKQLLSMLGSAVLGVPGLGRAGVGAPQAATPDQQAASPREDDPVVHAPTPPPPGARLITKVGWCEAQVFGRTYPELHLPERLDQLNSELGFTPGKSGVQLMDDVGALMQAVEARAKAPQSIGASTQPPANE